MALKLLILFATTCECEATFSTLLHVTSKYRNRLHVTHDMRVALSKPQPEVNELIAKCTHLIKVYLLILLFFFNVICYDLLVFCFGTKTENHSRNYNGSVMGIFFKSSGTTDLDEEPFTGNVLLYPGNPPSHNHK